MPTYEYECAKCGKTFEHVQSMKDKPLTDCIRPRCKGRGTVKRLIGTGGGVIFKGSGFYATDYKKSGGGSAKSEEKAAAKDGNASTETAKPAESPKPASGKGCGCGSGGCGSH
jgi:putative FmdB family regulatory protein